MDYVSIDLIVAVIGGFLILLQLLWTTHVPLVIYANCAGFVLSLTWGSDLAAQLGRLTPFFGTDVGQSSVNIALFLLPAAVTMFQFRGSMGHRTLQQFAPAVFWVFFLMAFTMRLLPLGAHQYLIENSLLLSQIDLFASWTVLFAIGIASVELLSQHDLLKTRSKRKAKD